MTERNSHVTITAKYLKRKLSEVVRSMWGDPQSVFA